MNASEDTKTAADDSVNQISQALQNNLPEVDRLRATALDNLQFLRTARAAGLQSEHERLSTKLGADHPRVAELAVRRAENEEFISGLAVEGGRARVEVPETDKETWILHGFVRDQQLSGVANVTVALYDGTGNWAQQLGFAATSVNGYFRLEARDLASLKPPLFIHVLAGNAAHLHTDSVPLTPQVGAVLYHEVVITGAQTGAPPGQSKPDPVAEAVAPGPSKPDPVAEAVAPGQSKPDPLAEAVAPGQSKPDPVAEAVAPPGKSKPDPVAEAGAWIVRGRVTDKTGKGLRDLVVSLYDKDLFFDDKLGQTETGDQGDYSLTYRSEDFRDLIERKPDIYVKVLDQKGKTLYTSKKKLRYQAGRVEIMNVEIEEQTRK